MSVRLTPPSNRNRVARLGRIGDQRVFVCVESQVRLDHILIEYNSVKGAFRQSQHKVNLHWRRNLLGEYRDTVVSFQAQSRGKN